MQRFNRKFVYYITQNTDWKYKFRYPLAQTRRPYTIHFNMQKTAESRDILKSYILGRLIDYYIQREINEKKQTYSQNLINYCIRRAEWEFMLIDFEEEVEKPMKEGGWSLDFIYLDDNRNRFQMQN